MYCTHMLFACFDFNSPKTAKHSEDINILEFVLLFGENEKNLRRVYMEN